MTAWKKVQRDFPVNEKLIWLNNAGTTPAGSFAQHDINRYMKEYAERGILQQEFPFSAVKMEIQSILADLIGAEAEDIAIIHNTAEGMNLVSHGLSLEKDDEILLLENEYPSNVYPWEHWKQKGVSLGFIPVGENPQAFLTNLEKRLTPRTRLVSLSAVHWCTGMPLPLEATAGICRERGIEFAVDGAQGAGHVEIDMQWGISFLSFSAWKWLLGPLGLGVLVVPREKLRLLRPVFKGTDSVPDSHRYLPYRDELKPTAERYMYSTANYLDWVYFRSSLRYLAAIGFEAVMGRIYELAGFLADALESAGFSVLSRSFPDSPTGIIVADKPTLNAPQVVAELRTRGVFVQERLGRLRISPHIYLSEHQLGRAVEEISRLC